MPQGHEPSVNPVEGSLDLNLDTSERVAQTLVLFQEGDLLARAATGYHVIHGVGPDFSNWDRRIQRIFRGNGQSSASATLLMAGRQIHTYAYHDMEFLLNPGQTVVEHLAIGDSSSSGNREEGDFRANASDIHALQQLREEIVKDDEYSMNEVNVSFGRDAVLGLFVVALPKGEPMPTKTLEAIETQRYLEKTHRLRMPLFLYSATGGLTHYEPTDEQVDILRSQIPYENIRAHHTRILAQLKEPSCEQAA